jgi:serine O-acetyltransferase
LGNRSLDHPNAVPALGNRVNVGAGAKVLGAVTIGDDAAIGANAVVLDDVPAGATAVGIPARVVTPGIARTTDADEPSSSRPPGETARLR